MGKGIFSDAINGHETQYVSRNIRRCMLTSIEVSMHPRILRDTY